MKKFLLIVAVAATALLVDSQLASARRGGGGSCGGSSCGGGGCGSSMGGCGGGYMGGCSSCGGGMMMGGCSSCGGGMMMGGCSSCGGGMVMGGGSCANGVCSVGGGAAYAQANGTEATLVVTLPADATLTIDDAATTSTSANRVFVTPSLEEGKEYEYTLKAQVVRDGQTQIATAKVTVRPGKTSQVELTLPAAGVAAQ